MATKGLQSFSRSLRAVASTPKDPLTVSRYDVIRIEYLLILLQQCLIPRLTRSMATEASLPSYPSQGQVYSSPSAISMPFSLSRLLYAKLTHPRLDRPNNHLQIPNHGAPPLGNLQQQTTVSAPTKRYPPPGHHLRRRRHPSRNWVRQNTIRSPRFTP